MSILPIQNSATVPPATPTVKPVEAKSGVVEAESKATVSSPPGLPPGSVESTEAVLAATSSPKTEQEKSGNSQDDIKKAIEDANEGLKNLQNQSSALEFSMDKDLGRVIVRLVDTRTKEVIRQYPPEEVLEIARQMDKLVGKLLKEKA